MDVFISHSANSNDVAARLAEALQDRGYSTWVDAWRLKPGDNWQDQIEKAIEDARVIIFLFEPRQNFGPWQQLEWSKALEAAWTKRNKRLVSVLIGDAEPPSFLQNWQSVRVKSRAKNLDRTADSITALLQEAAPPRDMNESREKDAWAQWLDRLRELEDEAKALKDAEEDVAGDNELVHR